jgi:hypothetical protein
VLIGTRERACALCYHAAMSCDGSFKQPRKIVSGGQTGVDRGALDAAMELGLEHGGWCPRGRGAEDGCIPARYQLRETEAWRYHVRTEQNVLDSDGTLILCRGPLSGGTEFTRQMAAKYDKPYLVVDLKCADSAAVGEFLRRYKIEVLNVAGPRESQSPGISEEARQFLMQLLKPRGKNPS